MTTTRLTSSAGQLVAETTGTEPNGMETCAGEWDGSDADDHAFLNRAGAEQFTWQALPPLSIAVTYVLLLLLGLFGVHQFYLRKGWRGGLYLLTAGCFGIGLAIDLFTTPRQVATANALRALGLR